MIKINLDWTCNYITFAKQSEMQTTLIGGDVFTNRPETGNAGGLWAID